MLTDFRLASASQIQIELGRRLRQQRLAKSWTQREVATRAGIAMNAVRHLESGGNATVASLVKVLQVLSLTGDLAGAFLPEPALSIAEMERAEQPARQRARKRTP